MDTPAHQPHKLVLVQIQGCFLAQIEIGLKNMFLNVENLIAVIPTF
jgi:hypothetical protein